MYSDLALQEFLVWYQRKRCSKEDCSQVLSRHLCRGNYMLWRPGVQPGAQKHSVSAVTAKFRSGTTQLIWRGWADSHSDNRAWLRTVEWNEKRLYLLCPYHVNIQKCISGNMHQNTCDSCRYASRSTFAEDVFKHLLFFFLSPLVEVISPLPPSFFFFFFNKIVNIFFIYH